MTNFVRTEVMQSKFEHEFLKGCCEGTGLAVRDFVAEALAFFDELMDEKTFATFNEHKPAARVVHLYLNIKPSDRELLEKLSKKYKASFSEIVRIAVLYYGGIKVLLPSLFIFGEEFDGYVKD